MILALLLTAILVTIAAVHVYWASGGQRWLSIALPQIPRADTPSLDRVFTPSPLTTLLAIGVAIIART
jgi:hypothetical protein